jgi:hypothetical protein
MRPKLLRRLAIVHPKNKQAKMMERKRSKRRRVLAMETTLTLILNG